MSTEQASPPRTRPAAHFTSIEHGQNTAARQHRPPHQPHQQPSQQQHMRGASWDLAPKHSPVGRSESIHDAILVSNFSRDRNHEAVGRFRESDLAAGRMLSQEERQARLARRHRHSCPGGRGPAVRQRHRPSCPGGTGPAVPAAQAQLSRQHRPRPGCSGALSQ